LNKSHSIIKKALKAVLWSAIVIVMIFVIMVALIQVPGIQNKIVNYATSFISNKTQSRVEVKKISIKFPKSVVIEGLYLEDVRKDTLLYAGKVKINIALFDLFSQKITISSAVLEDVNLNLERAGADSLFNFNFLLTAFADTASQKIVEPQAKPKWTISIDQVGLKNIRFQFDDEYGGIYITAALGKLKLEMDEIDFVKSIYSIDELQVESLNGNILTIKPADSTTTNSDAALPFITANNIQIKNSTFMYADSISKRSVFAAISRFELTDGSAVLDNLKIKVKSIEMDENSFAYEVGTMPETDNAFDVNHMKYNHLTLEATDLYYTSDTIEASIKKFNATDQKTMNPIFISGIVKRSLDNLNGENMLIKTGDKTIITTDFGIAGLTDMETAYFDFPNLKINTSKKDIKMLVGPSIPESIDLPENIDLQIAFKGKLKSFESTIEMGSSFGSANLVAILDENENFETRVSLDAFDLGSLLKDTAMFGPVTLTAEASGQGLDKNTIAAKIDVTASQFYLNRYNFHNLTVDGTINGQQFEGRVNLNDENAVFDAEGLVNLNPGQEKYKFRLNVEGADLQKLNITKDDIRIGLAASADLKGGSVNLMNGRAGITNFIIARGDKVYVLDSLLFASINEPDKSEINFSSALIDLKYSGTISPADISAELTHFIDNYFPVSAMDQPKKKSGPSNFTFEIQLHNHPIISQVLLPQLTEFEPGIIQGSFDSGKNELILNAEMKKIVYGTTEIRDLVIEINSDSASLNYKISGSNLSNAQIKLENFILDGKFADSVLFANVSSIAGPQNKKLVIHTQISMDNANYKLVFDPEEFYLMNNRWDIAPDNYVKFGKEGLLIHNFSISNAESQINIASVTDKFNDDVNITIKNFRLDDISRIFEKDTSLVAGNLDGTLLLKRVNNTYGIIADAKISKLAVREIPIGDLSIKAGNPTAERFDIELDLTGAENNFTANGYYFPGAGANSISIEVDIQSLSMKTAEAFSFGQISETSGNISGNLTIRGEAKEPEITGELVFDNAFLKPAVLNNRLELKHETIQLKADGIYFNSFTFLDADKHTAIVDGAIQMNQFKDFIFNLHVDMKDFLLLNTTAKENKEFFGRMLIDSRIDVKGPLSLPVIDGRIKMKDGSNFTFVVPEEKLSTDKGEDIVEFEDPLELNAILYRQGEKAEQKSAITGVDISTIVEIDKQATLRLLLDPSSTDSLVVKGEAALSFTMDRSGKMSLTGAYNLDEGSYLVSLRGVIKKRFNINPGSTIIWNGDPLEADISINATYSVRASPIDLVADQMSGLSEVNRGTYKQKYLFWVLLKLRGEILHPEISFEIQLPPENKGILGGAVDAKLNMLNEDPSALNKQVFALLILGRFTQENPLQSDAGTGVSSVVRSTVGKFLSAQLNQLSSRVVQGVELDFDIQSYDDYSTGQAEGRTEVEIGLKKQLFNERVTVQIGGTVDVEGDKAKQNTANDITSDAMIEYKLTEDGRYRLKGFRNYQYEGALEGQIIETGIGVSYVRDFNQWRELFRSPEKAKAIRREKQK
jgi:hypothetical protein